jgi:ribosomal protein L37E
MWPKVTSASHAGDTRSMCRRCGATSYRAQQKHNICIGYARHIRAGFPKDSVKDARFSRICCARDIARIYACDARTKGCFTLSTPNGSHFASNDSNNVRFWREIRRYKMCVNWRCREERRRKTKLHCCHQMRISRNNDIGPTDGRTAQRRYFGQWSNRQFSLNFYKQFLVYFMINVNGSPIPCLVILNMFSR